MGGGGGDSSAWLKPFLIPVLAVGFFFTPIPEEAGLNSTIVQKIIRFFAIESIGIADKASAVLTNTYLTKLYNTVGAQTSEGEKYIRETLANAKTESEIYKTALANVCQPRYPIATTFQANDYWAERYEAHDPNNASKDISYSACRDIERKYMLANNQIRDYTIYVRGIEQAYDNNKLGKKLSEINTKINAEQRELGFIASAFIPGMSFVIEAIGVIEDNDVIKQMQDVQTKDIEQVAINRGNAFSDWRQTAPENRSIWSNLGNARDELTTQSAGGLGKAVGMTTYFLLPGASGMYEFSKTMSDKLIGWFEKFGILTTGTKEIFTAGGNFLALYFTTLTFDNILEYLPVIVSIIAACIAIIGWILQLLKYFYISPFVVAFSLGTKNPQKITDFLITGLTVFFKPVLLVIFIGLALVVHTLIVDVFQTLALKQVNFIENIQTEFWLSFIVSIIDTLFKIIVPIGSIYIMWKLILTGPAWTFQLLGVEQRANDIVEGLAHKLERFSNPI